MAGCPGICLPIWLAVDTVAAFRVSAPLIQTARPSTFGSVSEPAFLFHWSTCLSSHTQCQTVLITVVYSQSWKQAGRSFNLAPFFSIFFPPILGNLQKFWNWLADSYPRYNRRDFRWCYVASVDRFEGKATLTIVFRPMNVACLSICSGLLCHSWQCFVVFQSRGLNISFVIPRHFMFLGATATWIIFTISLDNCLPLAYKNIIDFCLLTWHPETLLNSLVLVIVL